MERYRPSRRRAPSRTPNIAWSWKRPRGGQAAERKLKQAGRGHKLRARLEKRPIEDTAAARAALPPCDGDHALSRQAVASAQGSKRVAEASTDRGRAVSTTLPLVHLHAAAEGLDVPTGCRSSACPRPSSIR